MHAVKGTTFWGLPFFLVNDLPLHESIALYQYIPCQYIFGYHLVIGNNAINTKGVFVNILKAI